MREKDKVKGKGVRLRKKGLRWLEKQDYNGRSDTSEANQNMRKAKKESSFPPLYLPSALTISTIQGSNRHYLLLPTTTPALYQELRGAR